MNKVSLLFFAAFIIRMPFARGLYFEDEFLYSAVILYLLIAIFLLFDVTALSGFKIHNFAEISIWFFPICYLISSITCLNYRLTMMQFNRYCLYSTVCAFTILLIQRRKDIKILIYALYISGIGIGLLGLTSLMGFASLPGAVIKGSLCSTLQYHNAFGVFMVLIFILGLALSLIRNKSFYIYLYMLSDYILLLCIILSMSRGAWTVLIIGIFLLIAFIDRDRRVQLCGYFISLFIGNIVILGFLQDAINCNKVVEALVFLIIGMSSAISLRFAFYITAIKRPFGRIKKCRLSIFLTIILLVVFFLSELVIIEYNHRAPSISKINRVSQISLNLDTLKRRCLFYGDAIELIKDYPFLGTGGGGWKILYEKYQSVKYTAREPHSHFIQIWIDTGLLGGIAYIIFVISIFLSIKHSLRKKISDKDRIILVGIASGIIVLLLHCEIDFIMSIPSIAITFWILFGIIIYYNSEVCDRIALKVNGWLFLLIISLNLIVLSSFLIGTKYTERAQYFLQLNRLTDAKTNYQMAQLFYPINEIYKIDSAAINLLQFKKLRKYELKEKVRDLLDQSVSLGSYGLNNLIHIAEMYNEIGEPDKAVLTCSSILDNYPLDQNAYGEGSRILLEASRTYLRKKELNKAKNACEKILIIPERIRQVNDNRKLKVKVDINEEVWYNIDNCKNLMKAL